MGAGFVSADNVGLPGQNYGAGDKFLTATSGSSGGNAPLFSLSFKPNIASFGGGSIVIIAVIAILAVMLFKK